MKNFFTRALTAGGFVAVLLGCTYFGQVSFSILFFIVTLLGVREFYSLVEKTGTSPQKLAGILTAALLFITVALVCMHYCSALILLINLPPVFIIFILELYRKKENPFGNIGFTLLGIIYVAIPFTLLSGIVTLNRGYSYEVMFGIFFLLWCNDAGAYIVGSLLGKHKLFPRISPGKTWEGSIGGGLISYGIVFIISRWYTSISFKDWMVVATILIVIGTLGDLVESLLKRSIDVKDSGRLLPGHGGILDRFDSLIMATPFIFTYLYLEQFLH